jgi:ornithine cyclodeaminase/alanine dehydrogenase-like protein (mu-crystallin family)
MTSTGLLVLSRSDIARLMKYGDYVDAVEAAFRTGAATTLAARHLARPNSRVATVCGAGVQGRYEDATKVAPPGRASKRNLPTCRR